MVQAHQSCSKELEGRAGYVNDPSSPKEKAGRPPLLAEEGAEGSA